MPPSTIDVRSVEGADIATYLPAIARLRIGVFRDFPYLYDGSLEYETRYLQIYVDAQRSVAVLAFDGDDVIGASTGVPLEDETDEFKAPFQHRGHSISATFYCGESVLHNAYRGRGLYRRFFQGREAHARALGGFTTTAFCAVERPIDHALRPKDYRPLDAIWTHFGYARTPALTTQLRWKDIDCPDETEKAMVFWLKDLAA